MPPKRKQKDRSVQKAAVVALAEVQTPPPGRQSEYRKEFVTIAERLCLLGATNDEMAEFFGVDERTLRNWGAAHPEFFEAIRIGKLEADTKVARSLYMRATGYQHDAVKIMAVAKGDNSGSEVQIIPYVEKFAPDVTACIFWLKNRRPDLWRDAWKIEHGADDSLSKLVEVAYKAGSAT